MRDKPGSQPVCPNCSKSQPSWSIHCENRKETIARIEERRMNMPRTHKEALFDEGFSQENPNNPRRHTAEQRRIAELQEKQLFLML